MGSWARAGMLRPASACTRTGPGLLPPKVCPPAREGRVLVEGGSRVVVMLVVVVVVVVVLVVVVGRSRLKEFVPGWNTVIVHGVL